MDGKIFTPTDAIALQNSGRGYDGFGDGMWFWIIILLFFCNNGWGNRNGYGQDTLMSEEFIKRDIFNTNQNVSATSALTQRDVLDSKYDTAMNVLENRYTNQLGFANLGSQMANCCCETNRNIDSVRYDALLNSKDMQYQLSNCCCDLKTAIHAEGEATRAMIQGDKIEQLRDQVFATNLALNNQTLANQIVNSIIPRPAPAYPSCSPFVPSTYGYGNCGCNTCGNTLI